MKMNLTVLSGGRNAAALFALCGALAGPAPLGAQDQPTAFVHGFNSGSNGWQDAAGSLRNQFQITPLLPDLQWTRRAAEQRATLDGYLWNQPLLPAVGHSNGGLIARSYVQESGNNRVNRILAVNSAHRGAPLAANLENGRVKLWAHSYADALIAPISYAVFGAAAGQAVRGWANVVTYIFLERWSVTNAPVLQDMMPSSAFIHRLEDGRGTEAARAYSRVGIGTSASPNGIACHGLRAEKWRSCHTAILILQPVYFGLAAYYSWTGRRTVGNLFGYGGARLARTDPDWLRLLGAGGTYNGYSGSPAATDGILPLGTQQYPGNTFQQNLTYPTSVVSGLASTMML
jgi:pimeloyl-ACP methyl ester carboxylesterase